MELSPHPFELGWCSGSGTEVVIDWAGVEGASKGGTCVCLRVSLLGSLCARIVFFTSLLLYLFASAPLVYPSPTVSCLTWRCASRPCTAVFALEVLSIGYTRLLHCLSSHRQNSGQEDQLKNTHCRISSPLMVGRERNHRGSFIKECGPDHPEPHHYQPHTWDIYLSPAHEVQTPGAVLDTLL